MVIETAGKGFFGNMKIVTPCLQTSDSADLGENQLTGAIFECKRQDETQTSAARSYCHFKKITTFSTAASDGDVIWVDIEHGEKIGTAPGIFGVNKWTRSGLCGPSRR
jgi:hypothetical protein